MSNEAPALQDQQSLLELTKSLGEFKSKSNCIVKHTTKRNISNIKRIARQAKKDDPNLEVVFVDYLQKIHSDQKGIDPRHSVTEVSGALTDMAKDLNVNVCVMAQLNRGVDEKLPPQLSHLKESGAIEQDADQAIFIYRNMDAQREASVKGSTDLGTWRENGNLSSEPQEVSELQAYLVVRKNRGGKQGFAKCIYNAPSTKFKSNDKWKQGGYM
jgi:replicative DNA helicase